MKNIFLKFLRGINMDINIIFAIVLGNLIRILEMDGYIPLPTVVDGKLYLNAVGNVIIGCVAGFVGIKLGLIPSDFISVLLFTYATPYTLERLIQKTTKAELEDIA